MGPLLHSHSLGSLNLKKVSLEESEVNVCVKKAVVVACDRDGLFRLSRLKSGFSVMGGGEAHG